MKSIRVRKEYYSLIESGKKSREVRARHPMFDAVSSGEQVRFACGDDHITARVVSVRRYRHLFFLALREPADAILPGARKRDVLRTIRALYPKEKRARGFVVIAFELA